MTSAKPPLPFATFQKIAKEIFPSWTAHDADKPCDYKLTSTDKSVTSNDLIAFEKKLRKYRLKGIVIGGQNWELKIYLFTI